MFQGFTPGAIDFLWGVEFNNDRAWFTAHKQDYLELLDRPLRELSAQLYTAMSEKFPKEEFRQHVSRIYRDARRLHGRGPYKDHLWLVIERPGEDHVGHPAFYFEIAPNYYSYGCGFWDMSPAVAARLRARIEREPKPIETLARRLNRSKFELRGEEYKRPKGDVGKLLNPWYNRKNLVVSFDGNCEGILFTPALYDEILEGFRFLTPYFRFFESLIGAAAPEAAP